MARRDESRDDAEPAPPRRHRHPGPRDLRSVGPLDAGPVRLRPWRGADLPAVAQAARDPYLTLITTVPDDYTNAKGRAWIHRQREQAAAGVSCPLAVCAHGEVVGFAALHTIDWVLGTARIGYWILPGHRGHGYARTALRLLQDLAQSLGLRQLESWLEPDNTAAHALVQSLGFTRDGGNGLVRFVWQAPPGPRPAAAAGTPTVLLVPGAGWEPPWPAQTAAALSGAGLRVISPPPGTGPASWHAEADRLAAALPEHPVTVLAASNGCSAAVRLALDFPGRVEALTLAWPATARDRRVDARLWTDLLGRGASPALADEILAGHTLRGVTDAELAALAAPVGVIPAAPDDELHRRGTVDRLLRLLPRAAELPGCPPFTLPERLILPEADFPPPRT